MYEKYFTLPQEDFFEQFLYKVLDGTVFSGNDTTLLLVAQLEKIVPTIFKLFNKNLNDIQRNQTVKEDNIEVGWFSFPVTDTNIIYQQADTVYKIELSRMYNGHMGCNEDELKVRFHQNDKSFSLSCYIFVSPKVTFKATHLNQKEIETLEHLWQKELGIVKHFL